MSYRITADSSSNMFSLEGVDFSYAPLKIITKEKEYTDDETLDLFIAYSIEQDRMDIKSFKAILREYNAGTLTLARIRSAGKGNDGPSPDAADIQGYRDDEPGLTRDCSYYEEYAMKGEAV